MENNQDNFPVARINSSWLDRRKENARAVAERARTQWKSGKITGAAVSTVEIAAGAFGAGVNAGRTESSKGARTANVVTGGALLMGGIYGVGGKHSDHLSNLGIGVLAETFADLGFKLGQRHPAK